VEYDAKLLDELGRCFVQAALNELLRGAAHEQRQGPTQMTTRQKDKEHKEATLEAVRAELQR
jgi:hypothetical protein